MLIYFPGDDALPLLCTLRMLVRIRPCPYPLLNMYAYPEFAARQITQGEAHARQLLLVQKQLEESEKECEGLKRQRQVTKDARCVLLCDVSHCIAGHAQKHHKCSQQARHRDAKIVMSCVRRNVFTIPPATRFRELSCDEAAFSCSGGGLGELFVHVCSLIFPLNSNRKFEENWVGILQQQQHQQL